MHLDNSNPSRVAQYSTGIETGGKNTQKMNKINTGEIIKHSYMTL